MELEKSLTETLGTRVLIENRPQGGRVLIEFFSPEDLSHIAAVLAVAEGSDTSYRQEPTELEQASMDAQLSENGMPLHANTTQLPNVSPIVPAQPQAAPEEDLYSVRNFSV